MADYNFALEIELVLTLYLSASSFEYYDWDDAMEDFSLGQCDKTTSEMRVRLPGSGLGDFRRSDNARKHTYEAFKTIISFRIKLLHFGLKITRIRSRRFFKR
jgi:hypothetical protein